MELETMLVVLKDMQRMFLCEGTAQGEGVEAHVMFQKPLGITWQQGQDGRVRLGLSPFPALITVLVKDYGRQDLIILRSEIAWVFTAADLTPEIKTDYHNKKVEISGGLKLVKTTPGKLKGRER
jgi:hypothetical protein